jgi:hypothetical protein
VSRSRSILTIAAIAGLGFAWLLQPLMPPYRAHVRMILSVPPGTGDWDRRVDNWCQSLIHVNRTDRTGAVGARIHHPSGRTDEFDITISSRERGFSLEVVNDLVSEAVQTPGVDVRVLDPPAAIHFSDPSPAALLGGAGIGLLAGFAAVRRGIPDALIPPKRASWS